MIGVNIFIMETRLGQDECRRRFLENEPPRFYRPGPDSTPDKAAYLTDSEVATLRRRIERYLCECDDRRSKEAAS